MKGFDKGETVQLKQLAGGPVWDGDLISKRARDQLFGRFYVERVEGYNFLTTRGVVACIELGILVPGRAK